MAATRPDQISGLRGWWRATPADVVLVSGDHVSQWTDRSGLGNHLLQTTDAARPRWVADDGDGRGAVRFDNAQPYYFAPIVPGIAGGSAHTIAVLASPTTDSVSVSLAQNPPATKNYEFVRHGAAMWGQVNDAAAAHELPRSSSPLGLWHPILCRRTGAGGGKFRLGTDAADIVDAAMGTVVACDRFHVGAFAYNGGYFGFYNGKLRELAIWDRDLTDLEWSGLLAHFARADIDGPVIANLSPTPGTVVGPSDPIAFRVTDAAAALGRVFVSAAFAALQVEEVIHDGDDFRGPYTASTRIAVAGGWDFAVRRRGGWPASPSLRVHALDAAGNEAV